MTKPALAFRKPPTATSSPNPDAFVFGGEGAAAATPQPDTQAPRGPGPQTLKGSRKRKVVERADGRELRRIALYFPVATARKLATHCAVEELDMSAFVTGLVRERLGT